MSDMSDLEAKIRATLKKGTEVAPKNLSELVGAADRDTRQAMWRMIDRGEVTLTIDRTLALAKTEE